MRAWQVQGTGEPTEVLHLVEIEPPDPGPGQLRIRVTAAGLGLPDVLMCRGTYPLTPPLPFTPGQEVAGVVTAVGEGVDRAVGDEVMGVTAFYLGHGSFAEECLVQDATVYPVPVGLTDAEAAGFWIPHITAWTGLVERARIMEGESLVVLGAAGGSGIAAVQLGTALGARVIAVVSDEAKAAFCLGLGASDALVHGDEPLAPRIREVLGGGADVIYDPVGGALAEDAITSLGRNGRFLAIGFASGRWPVIEVHDLVVANTSLLGVIAGGQTAEELDRIHAELSSLIADGRLRNAVTATFGFAELPTALQQIADRAVIGKLVLVG
jgi:NADPH2:quinone reductase